MNYKKELSNCGDAIKLSRMENRYLSSTKIARTAMNALSRKKRG